MALPSPRRQEGRIMSNSKAPAQDEFFESLLGDFLDESQQLLGSLNENMLVLDQWVESLKAGNDSSLDEELMNELFRSAHSFKGLSGMLGLTDINNLTHNVENVFDAARRKQYQLTEDSVELLFQAIDHLIGMVDCLRNTDLPAVDCSTVIGDIRAMLGAAGVGKEQQSQHDAERTLSELDKVLSAAAELDAPPAMESAPVTPAPGKQDLFAGIEDEGEVPAKYIAIYIDEAEQSLDTMSEILLNGEKSRGAQAVEDLLIVAHRFKGSSASVGLHRAAKLAHFMEDILQILREQEQPLNSDLADALLKCTDTLRTFIENLKVGSAADTTQYNDLAYELIHSKMLDSQSSAAPAIAADAGKPLESSPALPQDAPGLTEARQETLRAHLSESISGVIGLISFDTSFPLLSLKAQLLLEKLGQFGRVIFSEPSAEELNHQDDVNTLTFALESESSPESIWRALHIASVKRVEVMRAGCVADHETDLANDDIHFEYHAPETAATKITQHPLSPENSAAFQSESLKESSTAPSENKSAVTAKVPLAVPNTSQPGAIVQPTKTTSEVFDDESTEPAATAKKGATTSRQSDTSKPNETLRVDIERLDQLMNLAGQLVINKARFTRIGEGLKPLLSTKRTPSLMSNLASALNRIAEEAEQGVTTGDPLATFENIRSYARRLQNDFEKIQRDLKMLSESRSGIVDLLEAVHQLDRVSDGIQKSVMDTRMVPVGPLFTRFKRVVRDITRTNGKDIQLVIHGEKTELDKRMIDELGDPLIHMVRNSADHGVETPAERVAAGKPAQGEIVLDAFHRGNSIVIEVRDDGRGLPTEKIRRKAVEKGIISEADAEKLTAHQVYQLIWEPGFSTAEKVTEISGRGMGMDIVRSKIEELSGVVELNSVPGQGTTFTIKLPLTLAILPSLMAKIQGDVFALPIESVVEIVSVKHDDFASVHGMRTASVRGRVVSVALLEDVFSWKTASHVAPSIRPEDAEESTLVIIGVAGRELGLCVDQLLGEEDVVIKSMAENYRNVAGIAGASILGDGRVALILDTSALIDMASVPRRPLAGSLA
jgi:two-component system, chemotaxis family, sensor kinase CheA